MAYIQQNDELMQNGQAPDTSYPQTQVQTSGASTDVGSGSGGVSTAGVGAGGTGGWTNIQAYLKANQGDTGSAQALSKTVGSQFDNEKNALSQNAQDFLGNAQKQVDDQKISHDQADSLIKDTSTAYDYGGNKSNTYKQNVQKVQGALTNQYSGPTSYNYGFSAPTQQYAQGLKDNGGFDQLMSGIYSQSAGKPLSAGQYQLQKQLDVNNEGLNKARQDLLNQYSGLETERDNTVKGATDQLSGLAQQYRDNQTDLHDYLGRSLNKYDTAQAQAEAAARQAYANDLAQKSGTGTMDFDSMNDWGRERRQAADIWGDNLSWNQLQRENDLIRPGDPSASNYISYYGGDNSGNRVREEMARRKGLLDQFYAAENQKYANTADNEKRAYNTVLDFLNSGGSKKQQGFTVKG